jgi:hypothetical protein
MPFNDIYSEEWEDKMGDEIAKAMEEPLNQLVDDLIDDAKVAYDIVENVSKIAGLSDD